jgi:hypothetical protein
MWGKLKSALGLGQDRELAAAKARTLEDHGDPRRRFVFGVLCVSYEADPAYLESTRPAVRDWYGIETPGELVEEIQAYLDDGGDNPAYDAFRAAFLARAGQAAGMIDEEESWRWAIAAARKVQRSYPSFMHYGMGYLEGHLDYRKSQGDDDQTIEGYRKNILARLNERAKDPWAQTPFDTAL